MAVHLLIDRNASGKQTLSVFMVIVRGFEELISDGNTLLTR